MAGPPGASDAARFERHLAPLLDRAYGLALRLTRSPADAEDLVQEAALLAFRAFHQYEEGTRFQAWYFRILTNLFYQRHRRHQREGEHADIDDMPGLYLYTQAQRAGLFAREADPAEHLMSKLTTEMIEAAIDELPEDYRAVAALSFLEDFGYQEVADVLGCPIGTVRSRLHRGRRLLQRSLWTMAESAGLVGPSPVGAAPGEESP